MIKDLDSIKGIDVFQNALLEIKAGFFIAQCTDKLLIDKIDEQFSWEADELYKYLYERAFDIRIFNTEMEVHIFRSSIDKVFSLRMVTDSADSVIAFSEGNYETILNETSGKTAYYDEEQFLDIDTKNTGKLSEKAKDEHIVCAIGGGKYKLPIANYADAKLVIRNYLGYDEDTGRVYVKDWRIVGFKEGK